jgi:DNA-binding response OmpR family regulator
MAWQLLIVDDDADICGQVKDAMDGESHQNEDFNVISLTDFEQAFEVIKTSRFDLLIIDVREGEGPNSPGIEILHKVMASCFLPVIFYTAVPHLVSDLQNEAVHVVEKTGGVDSLRVAIKKAIDTDLPKTNQALILHLERVQRDYMWNFAVPNWEKINRDSDPATLAYLLARRFALSLSETGIIKFIEDLGGSPGVAHGTHPVLYYVIPPIAEHCLFGDVFLGSIADQKGYWILLTPTCDIVQKNADKLLLASCDILTDRIEYQKWQEALPEPSSKIIDNLKSILGDRGKERFFYLPGVIDLPDLLVDFQKLMTIQISDVSNLSRIASLDSPFANKLMARLLRYYSRQGAPDLDLTLIMERMGQAARQAAAAKVQGN